jgi:protein-tyrosine phosphatase
VSSPFRWRDFHNHLVPGVDDGAGSLDDSLTSFERMTRMGCEGIITTPHIDASIFISRPAHAAAYLDKVTDSLDAVAKRVSKDFPTLDLRRGHEVRLDVPECDFTDERLRLGGTSFVLVEWPRFQIPPETRSVISRIRSRGFRPVIAHPERYSGIEKDLELAGEWKRMGAYLQVNYGSFVGQYGTRVKDAAFALLRAGLVDYFSSDFHGRPELKLLVEDTVRALHDVGAGEQIQLLGTTNPSRLFQDEAPLPVPPLRMREGFLGKVLGLLR